MSNMNIYSQKAATHDDELGKAQKAQKFYTDAVNLLVGSKPEDEQSFITLLNKEQLHGPASADFSGVSE